MLCIPFLRRSFGLVCMSGYCISLPADCLRKEVTPLAEVAYPEAYGEFKQAVLALAIGEKETCTHPAAKELWSDQKRSETAAMLSRTVRQAAGDALPMGISPAHARVHCYLSNLRDAQQPASQHYYHWAETCADIIMLMTC